MEILVISPLDQSVSLKELKLLFITKKCGKDKKPNSKNLLIALKKLTSLIPLSYYNTK